MAFSILLRIFLEKYWLKGLNGDDYGNQISFSLKYKPSLVDFNTFKSTIKKYQSKVKCCSVMPQEDDNPYEYQPEEAITMQEYEHICSLIKESVAEDIGKEHIDCSSGACPVDFKSNK